MVASSTRSAAEKSSRALSAARYAVAPFFARYVPYPHSVVTQHLIDESGQPTIAARDEILAFFARRLRRCR